MCDLQSKTEKDIYWYKRHRSRPSEESAGIVNKIGDPAYKVGTIPANTYNGQTADVQTVLVPNYLVTHEGVPAETVYKMTKSMAENLKAMVRAHAAAVGIVKANLAKGSPVPLHPGAERYYCEAGLLK